MHITEYTNTNVASGLDSLCTILSLLWNWLTVRPAHSDGEDRNLQETAVQLFAEFVYNRWSASADSQWNEHNTHVTTIITITTTDDITVYETILMEDLAPKTVIWTMHFFEILTLFPSLSHPEDGGGVNPRNVGKWRLDSAVCPRKFHWILSTRIGSRLTAAFLVFPVCPGV